MVRFDFVQHGLEAGTVKVGSAVTVIHEELGIGKMLFLGIPLQDVLLVFDGQTLTAARILLGQPAIKGSDFLIDP